MTAGEEFNKESQAVDMAARYQSAQSLVGGLTNSSLVQNDVLVPYWIGDSDCFWYERAIKLSENPTVIGKEYRMVNAKTGSNNIAFDHGALAEALAKASGKEVNPNNLPVTQFSLTLLSSNPESLSLRFTAFKQA